VSGGNVPLPVATAMEAEVMPSAEKVVAAARGLLERRISATTTARG
jgi:hypothetical protein